MQSVLIAGLILTHFLMQTPELRGVVLLVGFNGCLRCFVHTCTMSADVRLSPPTASRCCVKQLADYRAAPGRYCSSSSQFYIVNEVWTMKLYTNYDDPPVALAVNDVL